jgi:hypothetical protein
MVLIMLQFIKAYIMGDWQLHLFTTVDMAPYFHAMDRTNYARWLPVYIADMRHLQKNHPDVYAECVLIGHSVTRTKQPFTSVWTYITQ